MKIFVSFILVIALNLTICCRSSTSSSDTEPSSRLGNPLKLFNKCISDHECKPDQFCDHTGINPIGSCKDGKELSSACVFDRHCRSKNCHFMKCVARKPVKDGPCSAKQHDECIPTQYCSHKESIYKCRDRKCSGLCSKDAHCITNKCSFFTCKKPDAGCKTPA